MLNFAVGGIRGANCGVIRSMNNPPPYETAREALPMNAEHHDGTRTPATAPNTPLLVSASRARQLIGVKNTKFWELVKSGRIQMADVGGRRMVVYKSLETLAQPATT
jgi:hypothetical protein